MEALMPFTTDQFLNVFEIYNRAVWPMQIVLVLLALWAVFLAIKSGPLSSKAVSLSLAFLWLWMGIAYHLIFFTGINKAAFIFGAAYLIQAAVFFFAGVVRMDMSHRARWDRNGIIGGFFIAYALIAYPALGYLFGHTYPRSPTFGLPCPTTIFTFGVLLWADRKVPLYVLWVPLIWSFIGFSAVLFLDIWEDAGLLVAGVGGTALILLRNRQSKRPERASAKFLSFVNGPLLR